MKVDEYVKRYTSGHRVHFFSKGGVSGEFVEFIQEVLKRNWEGVDEEWQDFLHFIQLWLYWRIGINQILWKSTNKSLNKFMARVLVWQELYQFCDLPKDISGFAGNYKKIEKVINHLGRLGVDKTKATEAYKYIVMQKLDQ